MVKVLHLTNFAHLNLLDEDMGAAEPAFSTRIRCWAMMMMMMTMTIVMTIVMTMVGLGQDTVMRCRHFNRRSLYTFYNCNCNIFGEPQPGLPFAFGSGGGIWPSCTLTTEQIQSFLATSEDLPSFNDKSIAVYFFYRRLAYVAYAKTIAGSLIH